MTYTTYYESPIGSLEIKGTEEAITSILFSENCNAVKDDTPILRECYNQIDEYFKGLRKEFTFKYMTNGTAFQNKVWAELARVPYGETVSYKEIATSIENAKAIRAVGATNGRNRLMIVIPCHRIIGSNGGLTGYAGGLWRKEWLLQHEGSFRE
ncbi:methylated-DNA--[protein]-cysteine S-methyltransferase [Bacillus sp. CECT 9360]|uniref:methylated-DNA--[protein]-cysteine S-methyltransferase n=1 Tax=Bacillus sp. CECT 9360 TaxID=2845821 RepID=UPI001E41A044|nr:methylated-DNA--[protein]-cysteine S-methyltransferase [Bacillus sp. CECT 9360]CAH0345324.1 Methylated-DNA--protein-cysteine methyltransferase, constitutive [Bacillus sp. CECT 9360]